MKLSTLLAASVLGAGAFAVSDEHMKAEIDKRAGYIAVTGASGSTAPRLEIRQMAKNTALWNLYLLAMQKFMAMPQSDPLSYYQIAGIHGRPFTSWNGVSGVRSSGGYCPHDANMFLPWHRPYLALFEQQLQVCAQQVVNSFPSSQRAQYQSALAVLRMPYWDWAVAPSGSTCDVPTLMRDQTVTVTTPSGKQTINNPLYSYHFNPVSSALGGDPYDYWTTTFRRPVLPAKTARSNNNEFCSQMNSNRISLRDRVYALFTKTTQYRLFSTEATGSNTGNPESHDSIESVHDAVHVITGGSTGGHMYYLDYSAFDPAFWLHHTNIDRLGAMWQRVWPSTYVVPGALTQNNFQWNAGDVKDVNTALKPFTKDTAGNFWTPAQVQAQTPFKYYYPETSGAGTASSVMAAVNNLYGPNAKGTSAKRDFRLGSRGAYEGHALQKGDKDYTCHVVADKYSVGGSYSVEMYLSDTGCSNLMNGTSSSYNTPLVYNTTTGGYNNASAPTYVGLYGVLAPYQKQDTVTYVSGTVPLTTALQGKYQSGELSSLDESTVEAYLAKHLCWKVNKSGNTYIAPEYVPSLGVAVSSQEVTCAAGEDSFPTYGSTTMLTKATSGKPAGYSGGNFGPGGVEVCAPSIQYEYVDEKGNYLYSSMSKDH